VYRGAEISDELLRAMFDVYLTTIESNPYGRQYLNPEFFERLGGAFRQHLCFITAEKVSVFGLLFVRFLVSHCIVIDVSRYIESVSNVNVI
jgi:predicted N-acyltransferase